jgi:hypothetical protein
LPLLRGLSCRCAAVAIAAPSLPLLRRHLLCHLCAATFSAIAALTVMRCHNCAANAALPSLRCHCCAATTIDVQPPPLPSLHDHNKDDDDCC